MDLNLAGWFVTPVVVLQSSIMMATGYASDLLLKRKYKHFFQVSMIALVLSIYSLISSNYQFGVIISAFMMFIICFVGLVKSTLLTDIVDLCGISYINTWDHRFLILAFIISQWSKDPSTKCGAVIVNNRKRIISIGFNGFPMNVKDYDSRYIDRSIKYKLILHAEKNALLFADSDLSGCTIYVWPMMPCSQCAAAIIQKNLSRVVSIRPRAELVERWGEDMHLSKTMFDEAGIKLDLMGIQGTKIISIPRLL